MFDNRLIGQSTGPNGPDYNMQDMARDTIDLVQSLGWSEIDLLGFSMGGMIAQEVAIAVSQEKPFKIPHLILAATSAYAVNSYPGAG